MCPSFIEDVHKEQCQQDISIQDVDPLHKLRHIESRRKVEEKLNVHKSITRRKISKFISMKGTNQLVQNP